MAEKKIKQLLKALLGPFQDVETMFMALLTGRRIDNAIGVQLDLLGKLVGEGRDGNDDATYRRFIRARIAANNSDGLVEDAIVVTRLVLGDPAVYIRVQRVGIAAYEIELRNIVVDTPLAEIVLRFAQDATDAGIRVNVKYWPTVEANLFAFKAFPGRPQLGKGFGSTQVGHTTEGGVWAGSIG